MTAEPEYARQLQGEIDTLRSVAKGSQPATRKA